MKIKPTTLPNVKAVFTTGLLSCILLISISLKATESPVNNEEPAKKKTAKTKTFVSRNNNAVKIYPAILKRDMHVVAKDNEGKEIDFFVFDLQGTLVQNYKMKAKERRRISDLERGSYIYRVFCGDEETASGTFQIR